MGIGEQGDPLGRGGEQDPMPVVGGGDAQAGGQWVFPVPGEPSSTTLRASTKSPPEANAATCWGTESPVGQAIQDRDQAPTFRGLAMGRAGDAWCGPRATYGQGAGLAQPDACRGTVRKAGASQW